MFTFKKYEDCQDAGLSLDYISGDLKNEFYYSINVPKFDDLIHVVFTEHSILFCVKNEEPSQQEEGKVLSSISLTDVKETGHDLLFFAKDVKDYFPNMEEDELDELDKLDSCLKVLCDIYSSFPFAKKLEDELVKNKFSDGWRDCPAFKQQVKEAFLKFCLLEFLSVVDTHEGIFAIYAHFDELRDKLRKSKVYRLLNAKLSYYAYRYKGRDALNGEELTYLVRIYSDLLMDSNFNKMVPPTYYDVNSLLKNPEEELSELMSNNALIQPNTAQKIQSYFFTKHSVANGMLKAKGLYRFVVCLMGVWSVIVTIALLCFDKSDEGFVHFVFSHIVLWDWIGVISIICLIILSLVNKNISVFSPRILVTISIGWLTAFISEDLIKSQLEIELTFVLVAFVGVFLVISILVVSEIKQHSPYYKLFRNPKLWDGKLLPTLVYSYFWALTIGVVMQFALYDGLLDKSNTLSSMVYRSTFDDAETYIMYLSNFKEALSEYQVTCENTNVAFVENKTENKTETTNKSDSTQQQIRSEITTRLSLYNESNVIPILESRINRIDAAYTALKPYLDSVPSPSFGETTWDSIGQIKDALNKAKNNFKSANTSLFNTSLLNETWRLVVHLNTQTSAEIRLAKAFIVNKDNWDTLINWSCDKDVKSQNVHSYMDYLSVKAIESHWLCRKVNMWWPSEKNDTMRLYPRMLVFHTLIVLVLAFVGQLIISDKSVTEPL